MEKRRLERHGIEQLQVSQDDGGLQRVGNEGVAGEPALALMGPFRNLVGQAQRPEAFRLHVPPQPVAEFVEPCVGTGP